MSGEEYLAWEARQERKHELVRGVVKLMAGASVAHNVIAGNIFASLHQRLRGKPCRAFSSDLKVRTDANSYRYPDVTVDCGTPNPQDLFADQPTILFEVLSPSTEWLDEADKLAEYQALASVSQIVVVSQRRAFARMWTRAGDGWATHDVEGMDAEIALPRLGFGLQLAEIYDGVSFPAEHE